MEDYALKGSEVKLSFSRDKWGNTRLQNIRELWFNNETLIVEFGAFVMLLNDRRCDSFANQMELDTYLNGHMINVIESVRNEDARKKYIERRNEFSKRDEIVKLGKRAPVDMNEDERESKKKKKQSRLRQNLPVESVIKMRNRERIENMTKEQVEKKNQRSLVENMSALSVEHKNVRASNDRKIAKRKRVQEFNRVKALDERIALVADRRSRMKSKSLQVQWNYTCDKCGCRLLKKSDVCCGKNGKMVHLNEFKLKPLSKILRELLLLNVKHMSISSLYYNNVLALAGTGVDTGNDPKDETKWAKLRGPHIVKLHGRTTHFLPDTDKSTNGIQYFTYQSLEVDALKDVPNLVKQYINDDVLRCIEAQLKKYNPYVKDCVRVGEFVSGKGKDVDDSQLICREMNSRTVKFDVGMVTSQYRTGNRCIWYKSREDAGWQKGNILSSIVEPLSYPVLFMHGERGWGYDSDHKKIDFNSYLAGRLLMPEKYTDSEGTEHFLEIKNHFGDLIRVNRFGIMARLGQTYFTDMVSRLIDTRLAFVEKNQNKFVVRQQKGIETACETEQVEAMELQDCESEGNSCFDEDGCGANDEGLNVNDMNVNDMDEQVGIEEEVIEERDPGKNTWSRKVRERKAVFLSDSFHGSKRNLKKMSLQGLRVVAEYGPPTFFLTLTANPMWPEILENIGAQQTAFDRPEVVAMVFKAKLEIVIHNLKSGKYFGDALLLYIMYTIEWQNRGLPHVHIVFRLSNHPDTNKDKEEYADQYVCAERFPVLDEDSENTKKYKEMVDKYMVHKCYPVSEGGCKELNGQCKRGFNRMERSRTEISDRGFPKYRRRNHAGTNCVDTLDFMVVPHHELITLDYDGHNCLELCGLDTTCTYLYKYLYKGPTKKGFEISNRFGEERVRNEVILHVRGRYLCGSEAIWRIFKYHTYPGPSPSVVTVKVILPEEMQLNVQNNNVSNMEIYLRRPEQYKYFTYSQFWSEFTYQTKLRKGALLSGDYHEMFLPNRTRKYYLVRRAENSERSLIRIASVSFSCGEKFFLRLLMLYNVIDVVNPEASSKELYSAVRKIDGHEYSTFQDAAVASGLVDDAEVMFNLFDEYEIMSARNLRLLFINLTVCGYPTKYILDNEHWQDLMTRDIREEKNEDNRDMLFEYLLQALERILQIEHNKHLTEFGMPFPREIKTELQYVQLRYKNSEQKYLLQSLMKKYPLTEQQEIIYNVMVNDIDICFNARAENRTENCRMHFMTGLAGTGKTEMAKKLMAYARSIGAVAVGCAATALAATIYEDDWMTAHSLFAFPVEESGEVDNNDDDGNDGIFALRSKLDQPKYKQRRELVANSTLIIWDECASNHRKILDSVLEVMNQLPNSVLILIGGFEQILPIVGYCAPKWSILNACLCMSPIWAQVKIHVLKASLRLEKIKNCKSREAILRNQYEKCMNALSTGSLIKMGENMFMSTDTNYKPDEINIESMGIEIPKDIEADTTYYKVRNLAVTVENEDIGEQIEHGEIAESTKKVLDFLYGVNSFELEDIINSYVCAATNDRVNFWNKTIQNLNKKPSWIYYSTNEFADVDDTYGYLKNMFNINSINDSLEDSNVPPHTLELKVGDVCLMTCTYSRSCGLAKNTKVVVDKLSKNFVTVYRVAGKKEDTFQIPKLKFKFTARYGASFGIIRTQIPLRLAYSFTYNRSQGQTANKVVLDIVRPPFAHGHFYVAATRTRRCENIMIYCSVEQTIMSEDGNSMEAIRVPSITHKEILKYAENSEEICPCENINFLPTYEHGEIDVFSENGSEIYEEVNVYRSETNSQNDDRSVNENEKRNSINVAELDAVTLWKFQKDNLIREQIRKQYSMKIIPVTGNGSCLFNAISMQLYGHERYANELRSTCVTYMRENYARFNQYYDWNEELQEIVGYLSFDDYLEYISMEFKYTGDLEIIAMAEALHVIIHVYSCSSDKFGTPAVYCQEGIQVDNVEVVRIIRYASEDHFDLLHVL